MKTLYLTLELFWFPAYRFVSYISMIIILAWSLLSRILRRCLFFLRKLFIPLWFLIQLICMPLNQLILLLRIPRHPIPKLCQQSLHQPLHKISTTRCAFIQSIYPFWNVWHNVSRFRKFQLSWHSNKAAPSSAQFSFTASTSFLRWASPAAFSRARSWACFRRWVFESAGESEDCEFSPEVEEEKGHTMASRGSGVRSEVE